MFLGLALAEAFVALVTSGVGDVANLDQSGPRNLRLGVRIE